MKICRHFSIFWTSAGQQWFFIVNWMDHCAFMQCMYIHDIMCQCRLYLSSMDCVVGDSVAVFASLNVVCVTCPHKFYLLLAYSCRQEYYLLLAYSCTQKYYLLLAYSCTQGWMFVWLLHSWGWREGNWPNKTHVKPVQDLSFISLLEKSLNTQ